MTMKQQIHVTIHRSEEYCRKKAIETGRNFPEYITVAMPITKLTKAVRILIIQNSARLGVYPEELQFISYYKDSGVICGYSESNWTGVVEKRYLFADIDFVEECGHSIEKGGSPEFYKKVNQAIFEAFVFVAKKVIRDAVFGAQDSDSES